MDNAHGNKYKALVVLFIITIVASKLNAQDTLTLKAYDCAIVKIHIVDDCPCSHITEVGRGDYVRANKIVRICVDSVILVHMACDIIDHYYLINNVKYLSIPDSIYLQVDTSYIVSVGIEFDLGYVLLNSFLKDNIVYIENASDPIQCGFACESLPSPSCVYGWNLTKKSIDECDEKYRLNHKLHIRSPY